MITRIVIFLIRIKLGLKKDERFQFVNQKSKDDEYYFSSTSVNKIVYDKYGIGHIRSSSVSLNWLLNDYCEIKKVR